MQKIDPKLPHTWFNLGITLKKQGDFDAALAQFEGMAKLVPNEPMTHYQIGLDPQGARRPGSRGERVRNGAAI